MRAPPDRSAALPRQGKTPGKGSRAPKSERVVCNGAKLGPIMGTMNKLQRTTFALVADTRHRLDIQQSLDLFYERTGEAGSVLLKRIAGKYSARLIYNGEEVGAGSSTKDHDDALANAAHSLHWRRCSTGSCQTMIPDKFSRCPACAQRLYERRTQP
jgi:hypothetical protein